MTAPRATSTFASTLNPLIVAFVLAASSASAETVVYESGDFASFQSDSYSFHSASGMGSTIGSGGNPGAAWYQDNDLVTAPPNEISAQLDFVMVDPLVFEFDPMVSGQIDAIDFAVDVQRGVWNDGQHYTFCIEQSGQYYIAEIGQTTPWKDVGPLYNYSSESFPGLVQSDFSRIDTVQRGRNFLAVESLVDGMSEPDFSATAAPITVGLFLHDSSPTSVRRDATYDNFSVAIVPEAPTALASLAALGSLAVARRSRTRRDTGTGSLATRAH